mgnify:CR=1 FL=1
MSKDEYLITDAPLKALTVFAMPMILGSFFQQIYNMADSIIVGQFVGSSALAAVGACAALTNVFICVALGAGVGAGVLVSRYFGARDYGKMKTIVSTSLISFLVLSILLGIFGFCFSHSMMSLLQTPPDILDEAVLYLRVYFVGFPFLFMYNILSSMFNALGESRIPLYLLIFSSVLNIFLDLYMVATLHLGVAGAAYATFIAQGISAVCSFLIFLRTLRRLDGKAETWFSKAEFSSMSRIALPSILQQSTVSIGMMLVQSVVNGFGTQILAGFSAGMRIESLCVVPMSAIGNALSSYAAQNIGAEKHERIPLGYRAANIMVAITAVILCLFLELLHRPLIALFLDGAPSAQTVATGEGYLRFIGFFFCMIGFKMAVDGILRGAGAVKVFTIANLVNLGLRVLIAKLGAPVYGIAMIWYAVPLGWLANFLISYGYYRTGKWKQIK